MGVAVWIVNLKKKKKTQKLSPKTPYCKWGEFDNIKVPKKVCESLGWNIEDCIFFEDSGFYCPLPFKQNYIDCDEEGLTMIFSEKYGDELEEQIYECWEEVNVEW